METKTNFLGASSSVRGTIHYFFVYIYLFFIACGIIELKDGTLHGSGWTIFVDQAGLIFSFFSLMGHYDTLKTRVRVGANVGVCMCVCVCLNDCVRMVVCKGEWISCVCILKIECITIGIK